MTHRPTPSASTLPRRLQCSGKGQRRAPLVRAEAAPRPGLLARLAQGIGRGLTVVCTPAGFGKTTLLGDWVRRSRRPVAWLALAGPQGYVRVFVDATQDSTPKVHFRVTPQSPGRA